MRLARFGVSAPLLIFVATAFGQSQPSKDPRELILGKWEMYYKKDATEKKATFEFTREKGKDGVADTLKAKATLWVKDGGNQPDEVTINATYAWTGPDTIEMTTRPPEAKVDQVEKVRIKVSDKELIMSGKDGQDLTFKRAK